MTTTYELYTNENGTPKAVEGKAPAIIEKVEALENGVTDLQVALGGKLDATAKADSAKVADTAVNATKALQDHNGNNIVDTYATKVKVEADLNAVNDALTKALDGKLDATAKAESAKVADSANSVSWSNVTNKPSISASPKAYLTETWVSGTSGYRVWSDGYKEQWGIYRQGGGDNRTATITLPIAFSNDNYNITESILAYTHDAGGDATYGVVSKSAYGFSRSVDDYMDGFEWKACGF